MTMPLAAIICVHIYGANDKGRYMELSQLKDVNNNFFFVQRTRVLTHIYLSTTL